MTMLVLGASGLVGRALCAALAAAGHTVHGTYHRHPPPPGGGLPTYKWELTDIAGLRTLLQQTDPAVEVSSLTGDFLQQHVAHRALADWAKTAGRRVVYISSANVFDGAVAGGHTEAATPFPISQYGDFKQHTETMLLWQLGPRCLVARLPKIVDGAYKVGPQHYSNLYWGLNTPQNVAAALAWCIQTNRHGVVHLTSTDYLSDADMAGRSAMPGCAPFSAVPFTPQSYCALLGCHDPARLRPAPDGAFYLTMACTDPEMNARFAITCAQVLRTHPGLPGQ